MNILNRYIFKEIALHFVAVTGVLFIILASLQLAKVLYEAAANQFPRGVVFSLLGLTSLQYFIILVPIGLFLAILLALGRFYHDSEMAAMQSSGIGPRRLYQPVMGLTLVVALGLSWLTFVVVPHAAGRAHEIRFEAMRAARLASFEPKRFRTLAGGTVYYAESVDSAGILYNVFVQRRIGDKLEVVIAKRAEQRGVGESQQTFILYDGERYEGIPGGGAFRIARFSEYGMPYRFPTVAGRATRIETKPTMEIMRSNEPLDKAEFQERMSSPLMTLILAVLAVPLARLRPRQSRYAKMGLGLLCYFLYLNFIATARVWIEQQALPTGLGLWWIHGIALAFGLWLVLRQDPLVRVQRKAAMAIKMILARYVGRSIIGFTGLVMIVLMVLFGVYLFSDEANDIGTGTYTVVDALMYSLLCLPRYLFDLFPMGALVGALLGLGNLSRGSELAVMRASGVSIMRLGRWVGAAGILLAAISWIIGDYVAPPLEQYARQQKAFAKYNEISLTGDEGAWAKDGNTFIAVQQQTTETQFGGVYVFKFDDDHRLISMGHASAARVTDNNQWQLSDYVQSSIQKQSEIAADQEPPIGDRIVVEKKSTHVLDTNLSPEFLGLGSMEPDALPGRVLFQMIRHSHANGLDATQFETALWTRVARTVALALIVILAVPFAMGSSRSSSGGIRTVLGILLGTAFFMMAKMLENGAQIFNLTPLVVAWTPTVLLAIVTFVALARAK